MGRFFVAFYERSTVEIQKRGGASVNRNGRQPAASSCFKATEEAKADGLTIPKELLDKCRSKAEARPDSSSSILEAKNIQRRRLGKF